MIDKAENTKTGLYVDILYLLIMFSFTAFCNSFPCGLLAKLKEKSKQLDKIKFRVENEMKIWRKKKDLDKDNLKRKSPATGEDDPGNMKKL